MKYYSVNNSSPHGKVRKPYPFMDLIGAMIMSIVTQRIPHSWVYGFYITENFGTFEEVIAQDQVYVMNQ